MPRFCKICEEEFSNAAKLAEHMKCSDCSNHVSCVTCPYCRRDDFVDVDSLNRHLSHNRRCSRADYEATDKLSILAPDPDLAKMSMKGGSQVGLLRHQEPQQHESYVDAINNLEGNLVNIANVMGMQALQRQNTTMHPNPSSLTFVVRLTEDVGADGRVHKDIVSVEKFVTATSDVKILQMEHSVESKQLHKENKMAKTGDVKILQKEHCSAESKQSQEEDNVEELSLSDSQSSSNFIVDDHPTVQFDGDDDEESESDGNEESNTGNKAPVPGVHDNRPIVKDFQGGSSQLDCLAELYTMLDKRGVANSLFDDIATWAWLHGPSFGRTPPMKRKTVVDRVSSHVRGDNYKNYMLPKQKVLKLSTGRHVAVTYFPLENMIKDLLCNSTLMKPENLLISDVNNPQVNHNGAAAMSYGELDSGSWWRHAQQHECTEESDMLWPLIMFIDGMKVDNLSGKLRLEPITFTFSRFRRWVRNQDNAWRTWAYMEEVKEPILSRDNNGVDLTPKDRLQEYHDILAFLMRDLKRIQAEGLPWLLDLGTNVQHKVVLKIPLQLVIGDCEGHDKLVGRFKGHTMNIKGLCRDCDIPTQHSDDENWLCTYFMENEMAQLSREELREHSFHKIDNGFFGVSVGGCERGIRTLFNPEMLHLYESGHCEWVSDGYNFTLSTNAVKQTTTASAFFVSMNRGQSDRSFPPIGTFRDGLVKASGTNLQGHEKHERVFFIYLLLCCSDYVSMLAQNPKRGFSYNTRFYKHFLQMLEHCLGFSEWSRRRHHSIDTILGPDGSSEESVSQIGVRHYLSLLKRYCPRDEFGKNFKMTKFHQSLHLTSVISRHGSLMNLDGRWPESMAKGNVKDPASHTQRVASKLSYQTGKRYMESLTFREYKRLKAEAVNDPANCPIGPGGYINDRTNEAELFRASNRDPHLHDAPLIVRSSGTRFTLILDVDPSRDNEFTIYTQWEGTAKKTIGKFDDYLVERLARRLFDADDGGVVVDNEVLGCTAVEVDSVKYEAHPFYRNEHPWHDWVYIHWEGYDEPYPARIDMFLDLRSAKISNNGHHRSDDDDSVTNSRVQNGFQHVFLENKLYAVVWSTKSLELPRQKITENHFPLALAHRVELEPYRRIVPVDCFIKPCFGFLNNCGMDANGFDGTAIILKERSEWAEHFLSPR